VEYPPLGGCCHAHCSCTIESRCVSRICGWLRVAHPIVPENPSLRRRLRCGVVAQILVRVHSPRRRTGWLTMQSAANQSLRTKFPANREVNREFCRVRPPTAILASDQRADSIAYSGIPYAMEQGIFEVVSGKFLQVTGNFHLRKATAKSLNQPFVKT
jgi:hypothetical protein